MASACHLRSGYARLHLSADAADQVVFKNATQVVAECSSVTLIW